MKSATSHRFILTFTVVALALLGLSAFRAAPVPPALAPQPTPAVRAPMVVQAVEDVPLGPDGVRHFGYSPNPRATAAFVRSLPKPFLAQAGPDVMRFRDETPVLLYRALYDAYAAHHGGKQWVVGAQEIGDCVSWGHAHALDVHLAVMWKLGDTSEWRAAATEALYGGGRVEALGRSFGGYSDGSYGGAQVKFLTNFGAVFRQPYPQLNLDLTQYSGSRAKEWGAWGCGGKGDNGRLDELCKKHRVASAVLVTTFEEAAAAIQSGYPVTVCSGQGFSSTRDQQGFARASGRWAHCMCFTGVRFDRRGLLCQNSWGPRWINGPKWPSDQPDGSFWVDAKVAESMLSGRDSFAISGYQGFPFKNIKNGDWVQQPAPAERVERGLASAAIEPSYSLAP